MSDDDILRIAKEYGRFDYNGQWVFDLVGFAKRMRDEGVREEVKLRAEDIYSRDTGAEI